MEGRMGKRGTQGGEGEVRRAACESERGEGCDWKGRVEGGKLEFERDGEYNI